MTIEDEYREVTRRKIRKVFNKYDDVFYDMNFVRWLKKEVEESRRKARGKEDTDV